MLKKYVNVCELLPQDKRVKGLKKLKKTKKRWCYQLFFVFLLSNMNTPSIYLNDHLESLDLDTALPLLSEQRREQVLRYKHESGRRQSAAAYLLLCKGLREQYGITTPPRFGYHEGGKPYLSGRPDIHFNMSHCQEAAICAISDAPVGVDVESVRPLKEAVVRYTMSEGEVAQILGDDNPALAFTCLWTKKEALLKLTGTGIRGDMKTLLENQEQRIQTIVSDDQRYVYSIATNP